MNLTSESCSHPAKNITQHTKQDDEIASPAHRQTMVSSIANYSQMTPAPDTAVNAESDEEDENDAKEDSCQNQPSTTRRHRQKAVFETFFINKVTSSNFDEIATENQNQRRDDDLSIAEIMARQESQSIIHAPRDYQVELFERAKIQNTIAVLDTGSGKTLVAVLLLRHVLDGEIEARGLGKKHRLAFFLVDKVTLVFQQYAVLSSNLDVKIDRLCGAMGCDLWSRETWREHLKEHMVIVCTADVLLHCLSHGFVTIEDINILIFDEAHHTKKSHPYAKIMREFYVPVQIESARPRIFGMTASPVDIDLKSEVEEQARDLEASMNSQIATISYEALQKHVNRPQESTIRYETLLRPSETPFNQSLYLKYGHILDFKALFIKARKISSELGPWASDVYWTFCLSEKETRKLESRAERRSSQWEEIQEQPSLDTEVADLQDAFQYVSTQFHIQKPCLTTENLSSKVLTLIDILSKEYEMTSKARCLVFVEERSTAKLLAQILIRLGHPHILPGALIGSGSREYEGMHSTFKEQTMTLSRFRKGELNCLFATTVAEEGLDVPNCNVVIRFDLCKSSIQYVQSRGRARHRNSRFFNLLEKQNYKQESLLDNVHESEEIMRRFCETLPQDRLLDKTRDNTPFISDGPTRTYKVGATGAKLTYDFSLAVLAHFVDCLPHNEEDDMSITYSVFTDDGKFGCEVILPDRSPIRSARGQLYLRKLTAKKSAAFSACRILRKERLIDENLLPIYKKQLPALRNARLALQSKKSNQYEMRKKPLLWDVDKGQIPNEVFLTVIKMKDGWEHEVSPIGLLTRRKLIAVPSFPLFQDNGLCSEVNAVQFIDPLIVDGDLVKTFSKFTLAIFDDIFGKVFEPDESKMSYWIVPLLKDMCEGYLDPRNGAAIIIDWKALDEAQLGREKWSQDTLPETLVNKFLVDPFGGGRRFFTKAIASEKKATDPVPAGIARGPSQAKTILEYSSTLFRKSKARRQWDESQPVFFAETMPLRYNLLAKPDNQPKHDKNCFVCVQPLDISRLTVSNVRMCLLFPAIIHRFESYLIAMDFCDILEIRILPSLALEAITKDSDNSEEDNTSSIELRSGMGNNYERLEFIGDCFLKMATGIALFAQDRHDDEYHMHCSRMALICNQNLLRNGLKGGIFRFVRATAFSRRSWYPEGLNLLQGKRTSDSSHKATQGLADKTIADVCEAMIGAAILSHNVGDSDDPFVFDDAVKAVSIFARNDVYKQHNNISRWSDYHNAYEIPKYQTDSASELQRNLAISVAKKHAYSFKHNRLLWSAFVHPSCPRYRDSVPSYQRLEFLGDGLLDMAAVWYIFNKFPTKDEHWLTEHKTAIASNQFLGALCVKLGFHRHIRHESGTVGRQIMSYVQEIEEAEREAGGARDYWTSVKKPPKCLADVIESYVGAVFVDSQFNYSEVRRFFEDHIRWFFEDMSIYDSFASNHPVIRLRQLLEEDMGCRDWRIMARSVDSDDNKTRVSVAGVVIHTGVVADANAAATKNAKANAAHKALKLLEGIAPYDFRARYGCDCSVETGDEDGYPREIEDTAI